MKLTRITLYVCSPCNLACQECIMQHHMAWDAHYHMPLEEVTDFLQVAEASGYAFEVTLSGGEPLLWRCLNEAVPVLRASKSVVRLVMFTNALAHQRMPVTELPSPHSIHGRNWSAHLKHRTRLLRACEAWLHGEPSHENRRDLLHI